MTVRRGGGARLAPLTMALATAAALAVGCGPTTPTPLSTVVPTASPSPAGSSVATASAPASASASAGPSAAASPTEPGETGPPLPAGVIVDPGLLEVLPAEVDGVGLQPDPDTAAEVAADPMLAESALSLAVALAVAPGASGGENLAVANVIRLRPDVFDEVFYRGWRDAYNEAACAVAGGVESESQDEIGGRQTQIATCAGGALTYHTFLVDQGFLISITASGERRLGELILESVAG
jgi:hypothetical protein